MRILPTQIYCIPDYRGKRRQGPLYEFLIVVVHSNTVPLLFRVKAAIKHDVEWQKPCFVNGKLDEYLWELRFRQNDTILFPVVVLQND